MISINELYNLYLLSDGVTTDSRTNVKNKIFFALKGERFNGNDFATQAIQNGCLFAIVDDPSAGKGDSFIVVNNTLLWLQELANFHRTKKKIPLLALTGSNGKTTTKELITNVLSKKFLTLSTQGNLNNHIGVPLTLLKIKDHEIAVVEMGANHPGEIQKLCDIAMPDFGIITNIGKAHMEGFGTMESLIKTKNELYNYLDKHRGVIFVNYTHPVLKNLAENTSLLRIIYGKHPLSVCQGEITADTLFIKPKVSWDFDHRKGSTFIQTKLTGAYNLENILTAFTAGLFFHVEENEIIDAIREYIPYNNRSQVLTTPSQNTLILDAYNANPTSMHYALKNFADQKNTNKTVILGDMLELGSFSSEEHKTIINILRNLNNTKVFLVGKELIKADENNEFIAFPDIDHLISYLKNNSITDNLILIKGSRAMQLEKVITFL